MAKATKRNPEGTRERIVAAALEEFAASGYSGARVDAIARRAKVNKRMLYHYFGNKEELFHAVFRRKADEKMPVFADALSDPLPGIPIFFSYVRRDRQWVRLIQWEALKSDAPPLLQHLRSARLGFALEAMRARQKAGLIAADLDADLLLIMTAALSMFPAAFSGFTSAVTGRSVESHAFEKRWEAFVREIGRRLAPEKQRSSPLQGRGGSTERSKPARPRSKGSTS